MDSKQNWLERPIHPALPKLSNEVAIFAAVILLAIFTRFYMLEPRVMSHDESLHTYFSWLLYRGQGYEHSPMMHGPSNSMPLRFPTSSSARTISRHASPQ
jgi:hypothetical protein